jgi:hypothetical protein
VPSATIRMACRISAGRARLSRKPEAPSRPGVRRQLPAAVGSAGGASGHRERRPGPGSGPAAIGEPSLNWLGFSSGSAIGTTYATLCPQRIRALAGDGILEKSRSDRWMLLDGARAAEDGFDRFADWCAGTARCALHGRDVS